MYIITLFFVQSIDKNHTKTSINNHKHHDPILFHSKLASNCCIALSRAHCYDTHYQQQTVVPLQEQMTQMLVSVPYYRWKDGSFVLADSTILEAQQLATSILALSEGRTIVPSFLLK